MTDVNKLDFLKSQLNQNKGLPEILANYKEQEENFWQVLNKNAFENVENDPEVMEVFDQEYSEYDEKGFKKTQVVTNLDTDGDGVTDTENYYDTEGHLLYSYTDTNGDGSADTKQIYNQNGQIASKYEDNDYDGKTNTEYKYNNSAQDSIQAMYFDTDNDGIADIVFENSSDITVGHEIPKESYPEVAHLQYDDKGFPLQTPKHSYTANDQEFQEANFGDEVPTAVNNVEYVDSDGDGKIDTKRFYDAKTGNLSASYSDTNNDGKADEKQFYNPDNGNIVSAYYDLNNDGKADAAIYFDGSNNSHAQAEYRDENNDGIADQHTYYQDGKSNYFNEFEKRKTDEYDTDGDGIADKKAVYTNSGITIHEGKYGEMYKDFPEIEPSLPKIEPSKIHKEWEDK